MKNSVDTTVSEVQTMFREPLQMKNCIETTVAEGELLFVHHIQL